MKTNKELLAVAVKQLGNTGGKYRSYVHASGSWCDMFVFWLYDANGNGSLLTWKGQQRTYCPASIKWCDSNLAQIPPYLVMACDIIYFDWDKNRVPNHIGIVESKVNTSTIKTIEGNTSGGKVARKTRPSKYVCGIYRPHFKPTSAFKDKPIAIDGDMGYQTIYGLQKALKVLKYYNGSIDGILGLQTVKALQKWAGVSQDGQWGNGTSKAVQKRISTTADGAFGFNSVKSLQRWINANAFPSVSGGTTTAKSNAQKIVDKANELAWPYGTPSSKWDYKKGAPTAKCKKAMEKHGYKGKGKQSSCAYACNTIVRESGVNTSFGSLHGYKKPFPKSEKGFNMIWSGKKIPEGKLEPGDVVRYKKKSKDEHVLIYMGNNRVCEARHYHRFMNIYKDEHRYNGSNVKVSTIQVLRPKE